MGRRRKKDKHLPANIYHRHGAYYFRHYTGKWIHMGRSLGEMYRRLADYAEDDRGTKLVNDLCDRYQREILSGYTVKEQKNRIVHLVRIRAAFGKMAVQDIEARHIRAFRDKLGQRFGLEWRRPQLARKSLSVLSHVFSVAVDWGYFGGQPVQRRTPASRTAAQTVCHGRRVLGGTPPLLDDPSGRDGIGMAYWPAEG